MGFNGYENCPFAQALGSLLTECLGVGADRVHRNAEEMEHIITPELEEELTLLLDIRNAILTINPYAKGGVVVLYLASSQDYFNPYTGTGFLTFLWRFLMRMFELVSGQISPADLASDEVQILVLTAWRHLRLWSGLF